MFVRRSFLEPLLQQLVIVLKNGVAARHGWRIALFGASVTGAAEVA